MQSYSRDEIISNFKQGVHKKEIAKLNNISLSTVYKVLREEKVGYATPSIRSQNESFHSRKIEVENIEVTGGEEQKDGAELATQNGEQDHESPTNQLAPQIEEQSKSQPNSPEASVLNYINQPQTPKQRLRPKQIEIVRDLEVSMDEPVSIIKKPTRRRKVSRNQSIISTKSIKVERKPVVSIEDTQYQQKRKMLLYIKQYCTIFEQKLQPIIGDDRQKFFGRIEGYSLEKLETVLDNIRFEISLRNQIPNIEGMVKTGVTGIEFVSGYVGIPLNGLSDDLFNENSDFLNNLRIVAAEWDVSNILDPKKMLLLSFLRSAYHRYEMNSRYKEERVLNPEDPPETKIQTTKNEKWTSIQPDAPEKPDDPLERVLSRYKDL